MSNTNPTTVTIREITFAVTSSDSYPHIDASDHRAIIGMAFHRLGFACLGDRPLQVKLENGYILNCSLQPKASAQAAAAPVSQEEKAALAQPPEGPGGHAKSFEELAKEAYQAYVMSVPDQLIYLPWNDCSDELKNRFISATKHLWAQFATTY